MPLLNQRITQIPFFYTKQLIEEIVEDETVINLGRGDSEFQTPIQIINYLTKILPQKGKNLNDFNTPLGKWTHYEKAKGSIRLREAIARKYKRESKIDIDPECILITQGGMNAIYYSILSIVNSGDEIIIPDPAYVVYDPISNYVISGVKGIRINLEEERNFILTTKQLDENKTEKTKALILTSPLNPTGTLYDKKSLKEIMEWGIKNDIFIIHDENHEKEIYDNGVHYPVRLFDINGNHSILLNSFSRLGMGGWRLGWMVGPKKVIDIAMLIHGYVNMACNTFVQEAGVFVLDNYDNLGYDKIFNKYREKRNYLVNELNKLEGFKCVIPESTCYAFPNIREFYYKYKKKIDKFNKETLQNKIIHYPNKRKKFNQDIDFISKSVSCAVHKYLLYGARLGVIPGIAYGPMSDNFIRMSFSVKKEALEEAVKRLNEMLKKM